MGAVSVEVRDYEQEQPPMGYAVVCNIEGKYDIIYGIFSTVDSAVQYGAKLINARVKPIYLPVAH